MLVILLGLLIFVFLSDLKIVVAKEDYLQIIDIMLSSISISLGFFGALFTFVFGLKDNNLLNKVMLNKATKIQFKYLNILIISIGFIIIFSSLLNLSIIYFKLSLLYNLKYYLLCIIFSLCSSFYGFLIIFMVVITNIIFREDKSVKMETRKNPPLKKGRINE